MDIKKWTQNIPRLFYKYRYPIVILLVGLFLLVLPGKNSTPQQTQQAVQSTQELDMAQQLAQILSQIEGVGRVKVMLTVAEGSKTIYHQDEDISNGENTSSLRQETIIIQNAERNEQALITQIISPEYRGAVIVCQGADLPSVKWALVEAVSKATGLGADQITVLKMK